MPLPTVRPVAVITVVLPWQGLAGVAEAVPAFGVPEQGLVIWKLSTPMSVAPKSEVARRRITVVADVDVIVRLTVVQVPAVVKIAPKRVKLAPPLVLCRIVSESPPLVLM